MSTTLFSHTFSSGITVAYRRILSIVLDKVRQSIPRPTPPVQQVKNPDGITYRDEPNFDHPSYDGMVQQWNNEVESKFRRALIRMAVVMPSWSDEQREEIANQRAIWGDVIKDEEDVVVYITYVAMHTEDDYTSFIQEVLGKTQPTSPKLTNGEQVSE